MTKYKFGEEVEIFLHDTWTKGLYCGKGYATGLDYVRIAESGVVYCEVPGPEIRRPRKLVKARFQAMIDKDDKAAEKIFMIRDYHADEYVRNGHKRAGNVMEFEFDISEQS